MAKAIDNLSGKKIGRWNVIYRIIPLKRATYYCICDCGTERIVCDFTLRHNKTNSCGCQRIEKTICIFKKDLVGQKFNRLLVVEEYVGKKRVSWKCLCDCGKETIVDTTCLKLGYIKSCGCFKIENTKIKNSTHGHTRKNNTSSEYRCWSHIKARCYNTKSTGYNDYGGRGIKVCDRWLESFENFLEDMGNRPSSNHSIDRIDVNGNYEPTNCRWSTMHQQQNNKRNTIYLIINGEKLSLSEASIKYKIRHNTLSLRIRNGWDINDAITIKPIIGRNQFNK